jgi:hypothetical protein
MTETFTKTVDIKAVDKEARTATGAVLVPSELDHQHDFLRPDAVERFHADDPDTGVMHSAFPTDAADLERNEVIGESETIGDETFPPGTWVATRKYEDEDLWQLVDDGVLRGFSIGGEISRAADHDELPDDVRVPDDVDHEGGGTELLAGQVNEVSDVDIPAVPRASYKSDLGKSLLDETDSEAEFVELMVEQRGHEESDARDLYQYLTEVRDKTTRRDALENLGKPFESPEGAEFDDFDDCVETLMDGDMSREEAEIACGAWQEEDKSQMSDTTDGGIDDATKLQVIKSWLTGGTDDDVSPESGQSEAAKATDDDEMDEDDEEDDEDEDEMNDDKSADMSENDNQSDPPEWAKSLTETVEQIDGRVDKLEGDGTDEDDTEKMDDAPEWAQDLAEKVEDLDERVDAISKQSGHSQQLDATNKQTDDDMDEAEKFKAGLVGRQ